MLFKTIRLGILLKSSLMRVFGLISWIGVRLLTKIKKKKSELMFLNIFLNEYTWQDKTMILIDVGQCGIKYR